MKIKIDKDKLYTDVLSQHVKLCSSWMLFERDKKWWHSLSFDWDLTYSNYSWFSKYLINLSQMIGDARDSFITIDEEEYKTIYTEFWRDWK